MADGFLKFDGPAGSYAGTHTAGADAKPWSFTTTAQADPPVANDDSLSVTAGTGQQVINVLSNDSGTDRTLTNVEVLSSGAGGTLDSQAPFESDGRVRYTPPASGSGTDTFTCTISAGGQTDTSTLTVTVSAAQQPGSFDLQIASTYAEGKTTNDHEIYTVVAGTGIRVQATVTGANVHNPLSDIDYLWLYDDEDALFENFLGSEERDFPLEKVFDDDGTRKIVRGKKVYALPGGDDDLLPETATLGSDGYEIAGATFLGINRNVGWGSTDSHVYLTPGVKTITCIARKRGEEPVTATMQVTVEDPDEVYAGNLTICIDADSQWTGAPADAVLVTSWSAARTEALAGGRTRRIMLPRGKTTSINSTIVHSSGWLKHMYAAYGSGSDYAYFRGRSLYFTASLGGQCSARDLKCTGTFDPTDPWNTSSDGAGGFLFAGNNDGIKTAFNCASQGHTINFEVDLWSNNIFLHHCTARDWSAYSLQCDAVVGSLLAKGFVNKMHKEVVHYFPGAKQFDGAVVHGTMRFSGQGWQTGQSLCDYSLPYCGWASVGQPVFRVGRSRSQGLFFEEANIFCCRAEGIASLGTGNATSADLGAVPRFYHWESIFLTNANAGNEIIGADVSGMTFRNIYAAIDSGTKISNLTKWVVRRPPYNDASDLASMGDYGINIDGCTFVDLRGSYDMEWDTDIMVNGQTAAAYTLLPWSHVKIGNNVVVANPTTAEGTESEPLDSATLYAPRIEGWRLNTTVNDPAYAFDADIGSVYYPESGSNAYQAASLSDNSPGAPAQGAEIPVRDIFRNLRPFGSESKGAFEP